MNSKLRTHILEGLKATIEIEKVGKFHIEIREGHLTLTDTTQHFLDLQSVVLDKDPHAISDEAWAKAWPKQ
jgi:hypothetical protein